MEMDVLDTRCQERENPRGALAVLAALAAGVDISIFGKAAYLNCHWEGMCFGKNKEFLKMQTPIAGGINGQLVDGKKAGIFRGCGL
jgi:hypothetical protein